ncbi:hypothetical protein K2173_022817 [Erythroxylum novogranatense]|uniref:SOUL heme-binding protein n=1 Tax=Erythroxylum novogranatense TaxID=1862640 RepID=A0AAV8SMP0_9ROSI|nr:hypothetical protein K2173_022817 [Erythroxylum novogranatense]
MEKTSWCIGAVLSLLCLWIPCNAVESPQYAVVHTESDFVIRLYTKSTWMSAQSNDISFEKATLFGFHRLYQYIQGANVNRSRIPMTAPVVTSIVPGAGPFSSSSYFVRLYLPTKFQAHPPVPLSGLHLKPYIWQSRCVAVRKFSGYATDDNIANEAKELALSLSRSPRANTTFVDSNNAYSVAQYDSPFQYIGRLNEVWAEVKASGLEGCEDSKIASY